MRCVDVETEINRTGFERNLCGKIKSLSKKIWSTEQINTIHFQR